MTDNDKTGVLYVVIKTQFSATHHWSNCPSGCESYLQYRHRHLFYVKMKWKVSHDNRDIEFIGTKNKVNSFIRNKWDGEHLGDMSCEMLAKELLEKFNADYVSVFEDNENGAEYVRKV